MAKHRFQFDCPCCGKRVEVDTHSGATRAVDIEESRQSKDFDSMVADQSRESQRLDAVFGDAIDRQKQQKTALDAMFDDAKKKAAGDKAKPPNPFDLD